MGVSETNLHPSQIHYPGVTVGELDLSLADRTDLSDSDDIKRRWDELGREAIRADDKGTDYRYGTRQEMAQSLGISGTGIHKSLEGLAERIRLVEGCPDLQPYPRLAAFFRFVKQQPHLGEQTTLRAIRVLVLFDTGTTFDKVARTVSAVLKPEEVRVPQPEVKRVEVRVLQPEVKSAASVETEQLVKAIDLLKAAIIDHPELIPFPAYLKSDILRCSHSDPLELQRVAVEVKQFMEGASRDQHKKVVEALTKYRAKVSVSAIPPLDEEDPRANWRRVIRPGQTPGRSA